MLKDVQVYQQKIQPGGGLNTSADHFELQENESPDCMNVFFNDDGSLSKRYGRELINFSATGATDWCFGLFDYGVSAGVRKLVGQFGTTLYKMDDLDGTWDSLETGRTGCTHYFERSGTKLIICNENKDTVKYWDGSSATLTNLNSSAPLAKLPKSFQGYLFLANATTGGRRIYYEDESSITSTATGTWNNYFTLPSSSDDEIMALIEYNGRLYASLRTEWYRISFVGGSAIFDYKKVSSVVGAVPRTAQVISIPRLGEVLIYLGWNKKIYIFDESSSYPISLKYENDNGQSVAFLENINQGGLINSHAEVDALNNLYRLYVPIGGEATLTHSFNVSLDTISCSVMDNQGIHSACIAEDSNKRKWYVGGGYNGDAYKMDRTNIDEVTINNFALGADGALVETLGTTAAEQTIKSPGGGFASGTHDAGVAADFVEDATYNYTNLGAVAQDRVVNKTDSINSKVITSIANGAGTNARLNATAILGTNGDEFTVYKSILITTDHSIYLGSKIRFDAIEVDLLNGGNTSITPSIYYSSDAVGGYTAFSSYSDGTAGFTKSGVITYTIPSGSAWKLTNVDDSNTAFADTTTYFYIKIKRTVALTSYPAVVRIRIGKRINDYYICPPIFGDYVSALKKGQRINFYTVPVANYSLRFHDRKDSERSWRHRDNIPQFNSGDDFLGGNDILNSNILGSNRYFVEWSIDCPQVTNAYQYKIDSNSADRLPWRLAKIELEGKTMGIGSSSNKIR